MNGILCVFCCFCHSLVTFLWANPEHYIVLENNKLQTPTYQGSPRTSNIREEFCSTLGRALTEEGIIHTQKIK